MHSIQMKSICKNILGLILYVLIIALLHPVGIMNQTGSFALFWDRWTTNVPWLWTFLATPSQLMGWECNLKAWIEISLELLRRMKEVDSKQTYFVRMDIAIRFSWKMIPLLSINWSKRFLLYIQEQWLSLTPWKIILLCRNGQSVQPCWFLQSCIQS